MVLQQAMFSLKDMPAASSLFSTYASISTSIMICRSVANDLVVLVPPPIRGYFLSTLRYLFKPRSTKLTLVIEELGGMNRNQIYDASETYLSTKISPEAGRLKVNKTPKEKTIAIRFEKGQKIDDFYQGIALSWRFACVECSTRYDTDVPNFARSENRYFELSFDKKHKEVVLHSYLPYVLEKSDTLKVQEKVLKLCTIGKNYYRCGASLWDTINLEHPATFDTLAMEPDLKRAIIDDLDRFVRRKEFYRRVGRAWKRGYLLYGPPGTGKSTLVAAMANYLKFDIYDLQLGNIQNDADLRRVLLATSNRSILVIEDIDCTVEIPDRQQPGNGAGNVPKKRDLQFTLSGLLNFIDGLWSSCGDERIIIFTTNHKERLDPALLRPGRMDMHIHMSYCTMKGFNLLASNYLDINNAEQPQLFREIESYLETTEVSPAQVAEELMKSDDAEIALGEVLKLLKRKSMESDEPEVEAASRAGIVKAKRQKRGNRKRNV